MAKRKTKKRTHVSVCLKKIPGSNTLYSIPNNMDVMTTSVRLPYNSKSVAPYDCLISVSPDDIVYLISTEKTKGAILFKRSISLIYRPSFYKVASFYAPKNCFKMCYSGIYSTIKACSDWTDKEITRFLDNKTLYVTPYFFK
jgi:hypothetical protein